MKFARIESPNGNVSSSSSSASAESVQLKGNDEIAIINLGVHVGSTAAALKEMSETAYTVMSEKHTAEER